MKETYINLFTDFGFKKLFGEEQSKERLISFLNTLLPEKHHIETLHFSKNEALGESQLDRKAIFDLHCLSSRGEFFIVELQKAKQNYFKDRSLYYATFPIQQQAERGNWDYRLAAVYTIGILDFVFDEDRQQGNRDVIHLVQLKNQHQQIFYDKLTFIYLTLPNFIKTADELETEQDKWFFLFRHLHELESIPSTLQQQLFIHLFEAASIARFDPLEREQYETSLKYYRDLKNVVDTARDEGRLEGKLEGLQEGQQIGLEQGRQAKAVEIARNLLDLLDNATLAAKTGLSEAAIEALRSTPLQGPQQ